jgi:glycosyltransferase involved in cell wall biosynthesis
LNREKHLSKISIIIPVYFNAQSLPDLAERLNSLAGAHQQYEFEFIYVDDGSGDNSFEIINGIIARDSRAYCVKLIRNFGSNTAIIAGLTYAQGDCSAFIAADLQDPPETLHEMIRLWEEGNRVVLAVRNDRSGDPWMTRILADGFNWLFKRFVYKDFSPQGVGFFLVDRQVVTVLLKCQEKNAHLIGLILWAGYPYKMVPYDRAERMNGTSQWTFSKKFKYFIDAFVAFSYLPLRLASLLGITFAGIGGIYALVILFLRLMHIITIEGWTALMVVVLVLSGMQLLVLGIVGEYLWRNFEATRQRPLFIVDKELNFTNIHVAGKK